jgi:uncharacterized protein YbjT (DUF2867 family)
MKIVVIGGSGLVVMALVVDLLPHRIVADARKLDHAGR